MASEAIRATIEEAGRSMRAPEMSLFMTARRDLSEAIRSLVLTFTRGFDDFDEYIESFGQTEDGEDTYFYCLFSYRPEYKRTFSVATERDQTVREKVYRFLVARLDLKSDEIIFTNENGYDITL